MSYMKNGLARLMQTIYPSIQITKRKRVQSIHIRLVQDEPGKKPLAFLQYDYMHRRLDSACNVVHRHVAHMGLYPIPRPHWKVTQMSFGKEDRKVDYVQSVETGYSIKATKANLLKISSIGLRKEPPVSCGIVAPNGIRFTIQSFEDMLDGMNDPESLLPADPRVLTDILRKKSEQGLQEAPVTASQVQQIIERAAATETGLSRIGHKVSGHSNRAV